MALRRSGSGRPRADRPRRGRSRRAGAPADALEVELVELVDHGDGHDQIDVPASPDAGHRAGRPTGATADAADGPGAPGRPARPRRRRHVAAWAVAGAVVVALGAAGLVTERAEVAALQRLAAVDGVLTSVRSPLEPVWALPRSSVWAGPGVLVSVEGDRGLVGRDVSTGTERWALPLPDGVDPTRASCPLDGGTVAEPGGGTTGLLVCWIPEAPAGSVSFPDRGRLTALDAATGEVLTVVPTARFVIGVATIGDDLVIADVDDQHVVVRRIDLRSGVVTWRRDLGVVDLSGPVVSFEASDEVIALEGRTTVALAADDGSEIGRWDAAIGVFEPQPARVLDRPGPGFGVWERRTTGRWYGSDGAPGPELQGLPAEPGVRDASDPGVTLVRTVDESAVSRGPLRAVDTTTGEDLWSVEDPGRVLLRLEGSGSSSRVADASAR